MTKRRKIKHGELIDVAITPRQRALIVYQTFVEPTFTVQLQMALVKGKQLVMKLTLDDIDEILGYVAAEANHTADKKLQKELDQLYEHLQATMEPYDDGMWQGDL